MITKKVLAFFTISLFIGLTILPAIDGRITNTKNIITFFNDKSEIKIQSLDASSPYDYGLKVGRHLGLQYKLIDLLTRITNKHSTNTKDIKEQINDMEQYCPFILEEFKGLSASTHIKLERLLYLQKLLYSIFDRGCTTTASTGNATKNNETFITQNIDATGRGIGAFLNRLLYSKLRIKKTTIRYKYVFYGIPILYEIPILNEKGLGWGSNVIRRTKNESRYIDSGPGIWGLGGSQWNQLIMMTCKNVSEVICFYSGIMKPSTEKGFWNDVWCDSEGGILMVEMTHNHIITVFGNSTDISNASEGILWHAGHHQWLDPNQTGSIFPDDYPSSALRAERSRELLEENYGNITLDVCKSICRDHDGGFDPNGKDSGDICRHSDKNDPGFTMRSWIIQPKDLTVYWTRGPPCHFRYIKRDFTKIFA